MKFKFNKTYFLITILLFAVETLIAVFLKGGFIRHTLGDYLAAILVYVFLKSFIQTKSIYLAISTLIICFTIEFLQLTNLLEWLQLENNTIFKTILGSTFSISDLVAYSIGIITIFLIDSKTR